MSRQTNLDELIKEEEFITFFERIANFNGHNVTKHPMQGARTTNKSTNQY